MKIKSYIWFVLVLGCFVVVLGLTGIPSAAQRVSKSAPGPSASAAAVDASLKETKKVSRTRQVLSAQESAIALDTSISTTCAETAPKAPRALGHDAQVFSTDRMRSTLNGVWLGKVSGEYDPQLFAKDGFLNVDYYMVVDVNRGEMFVLQEFGPKRPGAAFKARPGAPKWTYVWCAKDNYKSPSPRQIHEFVKVSDNVEDAREIISASTGLKMGGEDKVVLADVWRELVDLKFFDDPSRSIAYAGALFKPLTMGNVSSAAGSLFELMLVGEYRGTGQTAAKFAAGEPIHNTERGLFQGISMDGGDFLVASAGLANEMCCPKDDYVLAKPTHMLFDKVVIGPLVSSDRASATTDSLTDKAKKKTRK